MPILPLHGGFFERTDACVIDRQIILVPILKSLIITANFLVHSALNIGPEDTNCLPPNAQPAR